MTESMLHDLGVNASFGEKCAVCMPKVVRCVIFKAQRVEEGADESAGNVLGPVTVDLFTLQGNGLIPIEKRFGVCLFQTVQFIELGVVN